MSISAYSTTAGSNTSISGINIAEGCPAANINNAIRAEMADTRSFYEAATWTDLGHTVTRTGATTFTVNSDVTAYYTVGRRIRCTDSSTLYGTIASSSYSAPNTTVTVTLDSGSLSASLTAAAVSIIDPTNDPIQVAAITGLGTAATETATVLAPTGMVAPYAGSAAPSGWLLCYGQAVSRTTYATLFAVTSTTFGVGDGSTTFNVPDLRGRVPAGVDNMGGSTASRITNAISGITGTTLGAAGGSQSMTSHTHTATVTDPGHGHNLDFYSGGAAFPSSNTHLTDRVGGQIGTNTATGSKGTATGSINSGTTGITVSNSTTGSGSSENVQPTMMLNYIIKH